METLKQRILKGEIGLVEFAVAKANNEQLPKKERKSDGAIAWEVAKVLRSDGGAK